MFLVPSKPIRRRVRRVRITKVRTFLSVGPQIPRNWICEIVQFFTKLGPFVSKAVRLHRFCRIEVGLPPAELQQFLVLLPKEAFVN